MESLKLSRASQAIAEPIPCVSPGSRVGPEPHNSSLPLDMPPYHIVMLDDTMIFLVVRVKSQRVLDSSAYLVLLRTAFRGFKLSL